MGCNPFNMLLDLFWWYFDEEFCIYIHKGYWPIVFFSCNVFVWFWYQSNTDLIEWVRKCSLLFCFLEEFEKDWCYFLKHLVDSTSEATQSWVVLFWRLLIIYLFFLNFIYLFIYLWLCWVFVSVQGLSLVAASGGHCSSRCTGLSLSRPPLLWSTGSRCAGSAIVAHGPSWSAACGILPDQGLSPCTLHWQADSQPLRHPGSPEAFDYWSK